MLGIGDALRGWLFRLEGEAFARAFMRVNRLRWRLPVALSYRQDPGCYVVEDSLGDSGSKAKIAFARKERIWVYAKGVQSRIDTLGRIYGLSACNLKAEDVVIDCGANIGELSALVRQRYGCDVISVEPEPAEARCISLNAPGVREVVNAALWKEAGELSFYSKNRSADSSIFETEEYDHVTKVQTLRLDDLAARHGLARIKLLKLEAEGAEPEILLGATETLQRIEYISADLGPERGLAQESTAAPVCNLLFAAGFEMISIYPKRLVFLFRNRRLANP
jgi:FkbM family methyltransferase